jgi:hypothetical protein
VGNDFPCSSCPRTRYRQVQRSSRLVTRAKPLGSRIEVPKAQTRAASSLARPASWGLWTLEDPSAGQSPHTANAPHWPRGPGTRPANPPPPATAISAVGPALLHTMLEPFQGREILVCHGTRSNYITKLQRVTPLAQRHRVCNCAPANGLSVPIVSSAYP